MSHLPTLYRIQRILLRPRQQSLDPRCRQQLSFVGAVLLQCPRGVVDFVAKIDPRRLERGQAVDPLPTRVARRAAPGQQAVR